MAEGQIDFERARDLICGRFLEHVEDNACLIDGVDEVPTIYWDNLESGEQPAKDKPWFRVTVQHNDGDQSSLGGVGGRRFSKMGIVTVQVFVPAGARGLALADRLGKMAVDAFEGKDADGVWFRRVKMSEIGPDGPWHQNNVTANFTYDQTK